LDIIDWLKEKFPDQLQKIIPAQMLCGDDGVVYEIEADGAAEEVFGKINSSAACRRIAEMQAIHDQYPSYGQGLSQGFAEQALFMEDFTDDYPNPRSYHDWTPSYRTMSVKQLRWYFTWRAKLRQGAFLQTDHTYYYVYLFELFNGIGCRKDAAGHADPLDAAQKIADFWRILQTQSKEFQERLCGWFKDFYMTHTFDISFAELVTTCRLKAFFPDAMQFPADAAPLDQLLRLLREHYKLNSFFQTEPMKAMLASAFLAVVHNLSPIFSIYGCDLPRLLMPEEHRFARYQVFKGALFAGEMDLHDKEFVFSPNEVYIWRDGAFFRSVGGGMRRSVHPAAQYIYKRCAQKISALAAQPISRQLSDEGLASALEQWLRFEYNMPPPLYTMLQDNQLQGWIDEVTECVFLADGQLSNDYFIAPIRAIVDRLRTEPMQSLIAMRNITRKRSLIALHRKQGETLSKCTDDAPYVPCSDFRCPSYGDLTNEQLCWYFTWRKEVRAGRYAETSPGYILLYYVELLNRIGTKDPFEDLCGVLKHFGGKNAYTRRAMPQWLLDYYVTRSKAETPRFEDLVQSHGLAHFFPALFLHDGARDLLLFNAISRYRITESRFYDPKHSQLFQGCFEAVATALEAYTQKKENRGFVSLLVRRKKNPDWLPFDGAPVLVARRMGVYVSIGRDRFVYRNGWKCETAQIVTDGAPILMGFVFKRMEAVLRVIVRYPYNITADQAKMLGQLAYADPQMPKWIFAPKLAACIDDAVAAFAAKNDLSPLMQSKTAKKAKKAAQEQEKISIEPPKPVVIDQARLEQARLDADALTEALIVELPQEKEPEPVLVFEEEARNTLVYADGGFAALRELLTPEQCALADFLATGDGIPPRVTEMQLEEINAAAQETIGDTLIDSTIEPIALLEDYLQDWLQTIPKGEIGA
jgi:hypothetical protein